MQLADALRRILGKDLGVTSPAPGLPVLRVGFSVFRRRVVTRRWAGRNPTQPSAASVARPKLKHEPVAKPLLAVPAERFASDLSAVWEEVRTGLRAIGCLEHLQLARAQRIAWLIVTYDNIVRSEGHKRYFRAYGVGRAGEVLDALTELGADSAARVLEEAIHRDFSYLDDNETALGAIGLPSMRLGPPPQYSDLDASYLELAPSVQKLLEQYMLARTKDFLSIDGAA